MGERVSALDALLPSHGACGKTDSAVVACVLEDMRVESPALSSHDALPQRHIRTHGIFLRGYEDVCTVLSIGGYFSQSRRDRALHFTVKDILPLANEEGYIGLPELQALPRSSSVAIGILLFDGPIAFCHGSLLPALSC